MPSYRNYGKKIVIGSNSSATMAAVLGMIYRQQALLAQCGRYANDVMRGLVELGLVRKVTSQKGTFYFKTEKAESFKAIDFAKEYLWNFHNTSKRNIKSGKKFIFCFDKKLPDGMALVELEEAIKKSYV